MATTGPKKPAKRASPAKKAAPAKKATTASAKPKKGGWPGPRLKKD